MVFRYSQIQLSNFHVRRQITRYGKPRIQTVASATKRALTLPRNLLSSPQLRLQV
jgi:hypothetical protein